MLYCNKKKSVFSILERRQQFNGAEQIKNEANNNANFKLDSIEIVLQIFARFVSSSFFSVVCLENKIAIKAHNN